jgi:hypothetical protein
MANIRVLGDVELAGALSFSQNYSDFPSNPAPRTIIVKAGVPYMYTELVDGSGFFTWQPIGIKQASYLHAQGVASTVWTITHNFNSQNFAYFVYDADHNLMLANIEMVDDNTCKIKLASAMTGTAVLFSLQYLNSTTLAASSQLDLGGSTLTTTDGVLKVSGNPVAFKAYVDAQDSALSTRIDNIASNVNPSAIDSISELLTAFQSADGNLSSALTSLSSSTSTAVSNEAIRATGAEATLQSHIDSLTNSLAPIATTGLFSNLVSTPTTVAGYGITDAYTKTQVNTALANKIDTSALAVVATTGNYSDLIGVPTKVSSFTNDSGYLVSSDISGKVDKVSGKGLSTEDYTTAEKSKLAGIEAGAQVNTVTSVAGKTGAVSLTKSDVGLANVDNTSDANKPLSTASQTALALKANSADLATVATSGSYSDLSGKPTKVSDFTNDSNFQTGSQVTSAIQAVVGAAPAALDTLAEIAAQLASDESAAVALTNVVATKATITYVDSAVSSLTTSAASDLATEIAARTAADVTLQSNIDSEASARVSADAVLQSNIDTKADSSSLATVATSGLFSDLLSKPTTVAGYGITDAYTKSEVDSSLAGKASIAGSSSQDFAIKNVTVSGDIMPAVSGVSNIGSATSKFNAIYTREMHIDANTLYVDGVPVLGSSANTIQITADVNQGIRIATTGTGTTVLDSHAATTIQTNGTNADVLVQTTGLGSIARVTSGTKVILTAPTVEVAGDQTVSGSLTIAGNLTTNGTTTFVDTVNLQIKDNVITVNKGENGSGVSAVYAGIDVDRGDLSRQRLVWNETAGKWQVGATNSEVNIATESYVTSAISGKANTSSLAAVATSGSYADLTNKPAIPSKVSDLTNDSGFQTSAQVSSAISAATPTFSSLTGKPTTVAGYGITDAYTKTEVDTAVSAKADKATTYTKAEVDAAITAAIAAFAATLYV